MAIACTPIAPEIRRECRSIRVKARLSKRLFVRYLEAGGTLLGLAKDLLQRGIKSPRGNPRWSAASLHGLLSNPAYTGKLYVERSRTRPARLRRSATHPIGKPAHSQDPTPPETWTFVTNIPALVSQEVFDQVQAKLALNKQRASRNNKAHHYLLRALVSCGVCQSACIARTTKHGHSYYMCRCAVQPIYSQHDQRCEARYSPAQQLDTLVWQDLCELLAHRVALRATSRRAPSVQPPWRASAAATAGLSGDRKIKRPFPPTASAHPMPPCCHPARCCPRLASARTPPRQRLASAGYRRQAAGSHRSARTGWVAGDGQPARLELLGGRCAISTSGDDPMIRSEPWCSDTHASRCAAPWWPYTRLSLQPHLPVNRMICGKEGHCKRRFGQIGRTKTLFASPPWPHASAPVVATGRPLPDGRTTCGGQ